MATLANGCVLFLHFPGVLLLQNVSVMLCANLKYLSNFPFLLRHFVEKSRTRSIFFVHHSQRSAIWDPEFFENESQIPITDPRFSKRIPIKDPRFSKRIPNPRFRKSRTIQPNPGNSGKIQDIPGIPNSRYYIRIITYKNKKNR